MVLASVAMLALAAGSAMAAPSVTSFTVTPSTANAGATGAGHNVKIHMTIGGTAGAGQDLKDLIIHLPPGLIANPQATPQCSETQLGNNNCPATSQVGEVSNTVDAYVTVIPVQQTVMGELFNVKPRAGEPGRFGIVLHPPVGQPVILQSGAALRSSDFGLDSILNNLPTQAGGLDIDIKALDLTLYGKGGAAHDQKNFVRLPTSCGSKAFSVDVTNYSNQSASANTSITTQNCAALPFSPQLTAKLGGPGHTAANTLPPVETSIKQTLAEAGLKSAVVALPKGMGGNINYLVPENYCSLSQFQSDTSGCPANATVGHAIAASPLLADPLEGSLILIDNPNPTPDDFLPVLGLDLKGALPLKIYGKLGFIQVGTDNLTGVTFQKLPDIPIADFNLAFAQDRLNLLARDACEPPPFVLDANFTGFSGKTLHDRPTATIEGCGSSARDPKATLRLSGGATTKPRATLKIKAGTNNVRSVKLTPPVKLKVASTKILRKRASATADGKKLKATKISRKGRSVALKVGSGRTIALKLKRGALTARNAAKAGSKLKFKVAITDVSGKTTKLTKTVTARR